MKSEGFMRLLGTVLILALAAYLGAWGFALVDRGVSTARVDECTLADGSRALTLPVEALIPDGEGGYYVRTLSAGQEVLRRLSVLEIRDGIALAALEEPFDALRPGNVVILDNPAKD